MRKVVFIDAPGNFKKLMIYSTTGGVYVFGYDSQQDTASIWDYLYDTIEEAENHCAEIYNIKNDDWIEISEPGKGTQHDFIMPTRIKGQDIGKPEYGKFQTFINGKWTDCSMEKCFSFGGLTGNERLFVSGLIDEFEIARKNNNTNATKILKALKFDHESIAKILI